MLKKTRKTFGTSRGFTLMELLVVISVIALLASLLLPALSKARDRVRQIKCVSNLRQIGLAINMYLQDWDGWWPKYLYTTAYGAANQRNLSGLIAPYIDNNFDIFLCPSAEGSRINSYYDNLWFSGKRISQILGDTHYRNQATVHDVFPRHFDKKNYLHVDGHVNQNLNDN